jgi:porin
MNKTIILLSIVIFFGLKSYSQNQTNQKTFELEAAYIGDFITNISGGIKTGSAYLGMANLKLGLNTENTGLWKGGKLFINAANTHGSTPSADLLGDFQVATNIEAGNHTYIQEFWYKQKLGSFEITAGLQDLNVDFVASDYGSLFLNSSFGIMPSISGNIPVPIFPLTTLGISAKWQLSDKLTWMGAIYDGCPTSWEDNNPYNLKWNICSQDGALLSNEFQYSSQIADKPGSYKLGFFFHDNHLVDSTEEPIYKNNYGFYVIADQILWQNATNKKLGMFLQLGLTPEDFNYNQYYIGAGINFCGLWNNTSEDILGLAIAHAGIDETGGETAFELTYQLPLTSNIFIQPNMQYIINPSGYGEKLDNCLAASLRFGLSF